jgi:hypothetical protein
MQDRPSATELLADIAELLEGEALEATSGALRHKIRVAGNLSRILEREVAAAPALDAREVELLADLLDQPAGGRDAAELTRAVSKRLDAGSDSGDSTGSDFERAAWKAALEIVRGKLSIAKPGHDEYDFDGEQP